MPDSALFALAFCSLVAGYCLERAQAFLRKRRWQAKQSKWNRPTNVLAFDKPSSSRDPIEQLRIVTSANFKAKPLLSRSEARVLYAAEDAVKEAKLGWRVMAQVSLGEILSSPDDRAYAAINSKRVD